MSLSIFVESPECYHRRIHESRQRQAQEARQRQARMDDLTTDLICDTVGEKSDPPVRITTVVNRVSRQLNLPTNKQWLEAKRQMFKKVGWLIRFGRLERVRRNFVRVPESDAKFQACLAEVERMLKNLPEPCL